MFSFPFYSPSSLVHGMIRILSKNSYLTATVNLLRNLCICMSGIVRKMPQSAVGNMQGKNTRNMSYNVSCNVSCNLSYHVSYNVSCNASCNVWYNVWYNVSCNMCFNLVYYVLCNVSSCNVL